jgi:hypothetical protein
MRPSCSQKHAAGNGLNHQQTDDADHSSPASPQLQALIKQAQNGTNALTALEVL